MRDVGPLAAAPISPRISTGVDAGVLVAGYDVVAVHFQLGEDALGIHQGLGATEADEADFVARGLING